MTEQKYSPFDFLNSINEGTKSSNLLDDVPCEKTIFDPNDKEKQYTPYIVNRGLSHFQDTILYANEMNIRYSVIPPKMQYTFLKNSVRPRKRFSKWDKKEKQTEDISYIIQYYDYSKEKAKQIYDLLSKRDIENIKQELNQGGKQ